MANESAAERLNARVLYIFDKEKEKIREVWYKLIKGPYGTMPHNDDVFIKEYPIDALPFAMILEENTTTAITVPKGALRKLPVEDKCNFLALMIPSMGYLREQMTLE